MNLNLAYNSVGFYQISKLACIPCTLLIQYFAYHQSVSRMVLLTLFPITLGVGYATVYDFSINTVGFIFATAAVIATAVAQIFTNTYQVNRLPLFVLLTLMNISFFRKTSIVMPYNYCITLLL